VALLGDLGLPTPGYQGRLQEAAYTSPSGVRSTFLYEAVSRRARRRERIFEFADIDGHYVQQNGVGGRSYPLRCYFTNDDHDLLATYFEASLYEGGVGRLEHPLYGTFEVVPVGDISRRNELVRSANESLVEVTFSTTLASIYPVVLGQGVNELLASVDGFNLAAATQFSNSADLSSQIQQSVAKSTFGSLLGDIAGALSDISNVTAEARRDFDQQFRALNDGLDILVGQPLQLAQQMIALIQAPAEAQGAIAARLDAYGQLAERIFARYTDVDDGATLPDARSKLVNDFWSADIVAAGAVSGSLLSSANTTLTSKPHALAAAASAQAQLDALFAWREARIESLGVIDTGETHQGIQNAGADGVGYLVQQSLSLLPERRVTLTSARTIVDLCSELYGSVEDAVLQRMIDENELTGSEILELPRGREIVYYA
jgi:hypothetical protein